MFQMEEVKETYCSWNCLTDRQKRPNCLVSLCPGGGGWCWWWKEVVAFISLCVYVSNHQKKSYIYLHALLVRSILQADKKEQGLNQTGFCISKTFLYVYVYEHKVWTMPESKKMSNNYIIIMLQIMTSIKHLCVNNHFNVYLYEQICTRALSSTAWDLSFLACHVRKYPISVSFTCSRSLLLFCSRSLLPIYRIYKQLVCSRSL